MQDNQRELRFNIYQGEAREVSGNVHLGSIKVPVPQRPAGEISADVRFTYDSSGLLEVGVVIPETGLTRNLVIIDDADSTADEDLAARRKALAKLKFHPREEAQNVALLARVERLYEEYLGEDRQIIGRWITEFVGALDSQDGRRIAEARALIGERVAALEASSPL